MKPPVMPAIKPGFGAEIGSGAGALNTAPKLDKIVNVTGEPLVAKFENPIAGEKPSGLVDQFGRPLPSVLGSMDNHQGISAVASIDASAVTSAPGLNGSSSPEAKAAEVTTAENKLKTAAELASERESSMAATVNAEKQASSSENEAQPQAENADHSLQSNAAEATATAQTVETGGQAKTDQAADKTKEGDQTKPAENMDREKRRTELAERVKNDTASDEEREELNKLNENPEQRRQELKDRLGNGEHLSEKEMEELNSLSKSETTANLTPEQQAEKLNKDIEDLGTELMTKMQNGEMPDQKDIDRFRELWGKKTLMDQGFTPDQARLAMKEAMTRGGRTSERQTLAMKEIQEKLRELMTLEMQIMAIPKTVDELRRQRKIVQDQAQAKHREAESLSGEKRLLKKGEEYSLYMQIVNFNAAIISQKYMVPVLEAKRSDIEQYVRRRLGVSSPLGAALEWAGAKTTKALTHLNVSVQEEMDSGFGNY